MIAGVAALTGAVTFLASLDRVVEDPEGYRWTFDAVAGLIYEDDPGDLFETLAGDPGVETFARAGGAPVGAEGHRIGVLGVEMGRGIAPAVILDGRAPAGVHEVALGRRTLDGLGKDVGDTLAIDGGAGLTITGSAVVPEINQGGPGLGEGAVMTLEGFQEVAPQAPPNVALVRFAPGGEDSAVMDKLRFDGELLPPVLPDALFDVQRVRALPTVLAALFPAG